VLFLDWHLTLEESTLSADEIPEPTASRSANLNLQFERLKINPRDDFTLDAAYTTFNKKMQL
jgi:hypothetical protein